jgi:presenilin-like A22 family membrane protease
MGGEYAVLLLVALDWSCIAVKRSCKNLYRAFWTVDVAAVSVPLVLLELSVPLVVDDESMLNPIWLSASWTALIIPSPRGGRGGVC